MADLRDQLQIGLADRYRIERELGRGGMATVYLAHDLRHDRPVALKALHPSLAATLGPERFEREIRLAARLQHPHICGVLDSGEAGGQLWFTMPFVEGETLRQRLERQRQVPVEEAVRLTLEAADALQYAHERGVVHRDVKPENILLTGSHALVADFGVAKALHGSAEVPTLAANSITGTGMAIGTPAYMSPEQASGSKELGPSTDVYALGCVLYEMIAGEPPFTGPTIQAIIAKRLATDPTPLTVLRPDVPAGLAAAIARAMHRTPAERYPSAGEFARALEQAMRPVPAAAHAPTAAPPWFRRGAAIFVVGVVVGLGVLFAWRRDHADVPTAEGGVKRLAVLPFDNQGAPADDYFADGVTDEIRGKLASLPGLQVTARSSSAPYKRSSRTPADIGRELGVDYLLTGTVRWEKGAGGNRVRVSPELIQVSTGSSRWQQPFDAALSDVFQVQADIAGRVAEALNLALEAPKQRELAERPTTSLAAYDAFLKGEDVAQGIWGVSPGKLRNAAAYYEQAVALDSSFALAWAQLSRVLSYAYFIGTPSPSDAERARFAAERAIALAPTKSAGHLALGDYQRNIATDNERASNEYTQALRLAPNDVDLLTGAALAEQSLGQWDESVAQLRRSLTLDPRSVTTARRLAFTLLWVRQYQDALAVSEAALRLAPSHLQARSTRAMMYLAQGNLDGARQVVRETPSEIEPTTLVAYIATYWDLYWLLDEEQQKLLLRLQPSSFDEDRGNWGQVLAEVYALRGDSARAHAFADTARIAFETQLKATPNDAQRHVLLGLVLAYLGRKVEAIREGETGVALLPVSRDAYGGAYNEHQLARIYILTGEHQKALDRLEHLLSIPYYLSPGWLKVDPTFAPLRNEPRFKKLVAEGR
ncbi:MAG TPA: protein kinase [Gemmatimonadales bacterium]|nr:protein kinase [Gemmatimonadales bacterium]